MADLSLAQLQAIVSTERLGPYRAAAPSDEEAVSLYLWNAHVSAAFFEMLGHVEVLLRNTIHDALDHLQSGAPGRSGRTWFDEPKWTRHHWLSRQAAMDRDKAAKRARHAAVTSPRPGKVVSELTFGFWRYMLSARYEQSFWVPALDAAFAIPGSTPAMRRSIIEDTVEPLHRVRNRVAHHEPLINDVSLKRRGGVTIVLPLDAIVTNAFELASWISPDALSVVDGSDRVTHLLAERPC